MAAGGQLDRKPPHRAPGQTSEALEGQIAPIDYGLHLLSMPHRRNPGTFTRHLKHHILPVNGHKRRPRHVYGRDGGGAG